MTVDQSILNSVKKSLNVSVDDTAFDSDIIMCINSAFSTLNQLGIGPEEGFSIEDNTGVWASLIGTNKKYNSVKTYVYLSTKLIFDASTMTAHYMSAMKEQLRELEWRLNVLREETDWVDPRPIETSSELVLDGGHP